MGRPGRFAQPDGDSGENLVSKSAQQMIHLPINQIESHQFQANENRRGGSNFSWHELVNEFRLSSIVKRETREKPTSHMSTPTTNSYITIAIGGWSEGSGKYSDMAETLANRKAFIDSVLIFIKRINVYVMIKYSPLQIQKHKDVKEKPTYMKQYFYD
ncbi:hypothetical protein DAPPUDRAFT_267475 [Daphnia pulex]|uniref:GH18 domain-containing protein n=1 Tax=Daphnia pulex TaxID=6669 RepID=E9HWK1_DAPPU|nr:hypothetical protein DAPPUDRAFT_267475 [Daphnia pulex]|eukprot:EFX63880.1 hypothetical protein DAPPUDRAFT_267475 [Daphnia pulex]